MAPIFLPFHQDRIIFDSLSWLRGEGMGLQGFLLGLICPTSSHGADQGGQCEAFARC